jgi:hypothetical protein
MTYPYNGGWNPATEPPEPDPTLDDLPEFLHDDNRRIVAEELCELADEDARDTFIAWLVDEGDAQMIWSALANNLPLMRQFRESDTAKPIIERLKDDRLTKFYLSSKSDDDYWEPK